MKIGAPGPSGRAVSSAQPSTSHLASGVRSICLATFLTCPRTPLSPAAERSPAEKESADMAKERVRRGNFGSTIGHLKVDGPLDFWGGCPAAPLGPWAPVQCSGRGGAMERPVPLSR